MKCDDVRDLILTDLADGRADLRLAEDIRCHIRECADCRLVLASVEDCDERLKRTEDIVVPTEKIWSVVRERVERPPVSAAEEWLTAVQQWWDGLFVAPRRLAYAASFAMVVIFCGVVFPIAHTSGQRAVSREVSTWMMSSLDDYENGEAEAEWLGANEDLLML